MNTEVTFGVLDITEDSMTQGFRLAACKKCELLVDLCHKFHGKPKQNMIEKSLYVCEIWGSYSGVAED